MGPNKFICPFLKKVHEITLFNVNKRMILAAMLGKASYLAFLDGYLNRIDTLLSWKEERMQYPQYILQLAT